jgi:hypothetical protein
MGPPTTTLVWLPCPASADTAIANYTTCWEGAAWRARDAASSMLIPLTVDEGVPCQCSFPHVTGAQQFDVTGARVFRMYPMLLTPQVCACKVGLAKDSLCEAALGEILTG